MGEIRMTRDGSMKVLDNPEAHPEARAIAACALAFFEVNGMAMEGVEGSRTAAICHKLLRMAERALDGGEA